MRVFSQNEVRAYLALVLLIILVSVYVQWFLYLCECEMKAYVSLVLRLNELQGCGSSCMGHKNMHGLIPSALILPSSY